MRLVDIASYQAGIDLAKVKAAGYGLVNIKLSQGNWYTYGDGRAHADTARALGMGVSTFHWLDNSDTGANQAAYAYRQMLALGGPDGMAHQCDNEDAARPATWAITRDYVNWWQDKLGRPIYMYTGDWWATNPARAGWDVASLTPYLMAAPNAGYLGTYPGDDSPHWNAGYWRYRSLSLMQYAVQPITGAGGGDLSQTAIRDPAVWAALTGGDAEMLTDQEVARVAAYVVYGGDERGRALDVLPKVDPNLAITARQIDRYNLEALHKWLDERLSTMQPGGAPTQEQVDAAVHKALSDPAIQAGIGAGFLRALRQG